MSKSRERSDFEGELEFHEREWRVERIGWLLMLAFIIAAVLGVFGEGPMSSRTIGDARTATLEYERFIRYASPTLLELTIPAAVPGPITLEVNESFLADFEIASIAPEPTGAQLVGERYRFEFDLEGAPATIAIRLKPEKIGSKHGSFVIAGTQLDFAQFVYP